MSSTISRTWCSRIRGGLLALAAALLVLFGAGLGRPVRASDAGVAELIDDCVYASAAPPACAAGQPVAGSVAFDQVAGGLVLTIQLAGDQLPGEYALLLSGCGAGGVLSCGTIAAGSLALGQEGAAGPFTVTVPTQELRGAPFAVTGLNTIKLSLVKPGAVRGHSHPGVLAASGIRFLLP